MTIDVSELRGWLEACIDRLAINENGLNDQGYVRLQTLREVLGQLPVSLETGDGAANESPTIEPGTVLVNGQPVDASSPEGAREIMAGAAAGPAHGPAPEGVWWVATGAGRQPADDVWQREWECTGCRTLTWYFDVPPACVACAAPEGDTEPPCESVEVRRWDGSASGLRELADWAGNDPTGEPQFSWLRIGNQNGGDFHDPMLGEIGVKPGDLFAKVSGWVLPAAQPEGDTETVTLYRNPSNGMWWQATPATLDSVYSDGLNWDVAEFTRTSEVHRKRPASSTEGGEG